MKTILLFIVPFGLATASSTFTCGISLGYPPYQYVKNEVAQGIDPQIAELFNQTSEIKVKLRPMPWKTALAKLYYTDELDCVWGMEKSNVRAERYLLSRPIYDRRSALFVLDESNVSDFNDLKNKVIIGDKSSALDEEIRKTNIPGIRIRETMTKEMSYQLLKEKKVFGIVLPFAVGKYLSQRNGGHIKAALVAKQDTPVSVAVKKGNEELLKQIEDGVQKIPREKIEEIVAPWRYPTPSSGLSRDKSVK